MNSADVIAYTDTINSCRLCDHCGESEAGCEPVFADNETDIAGDTCENCRSFYVVGDGWQPYTEVTYYHWARCRRCNHVEPARTDDARTRLAYMRGARCPSCGRHELHWR